MFEMFSGSKVLVTGHTGFKGSWLSLWLNMLCADVYGLSNKVPTHPSHIESALPDMLHEESFIDISQTGNVINYIREINPDFIFHLAAQPLVRMAYENPLETWSTNTLGTISVLEYLRNSEDDCVAVFITSDKCYDNVEWTWGYRENDKIGGVDPYSASKGAAELAIRSYSESYFRKDGRVRIGIGRAGNVIGGGDWAENRIVPDCMRSWSVDETVQIRQPQATRPWQHVLEPLSGYLCLAAELAVRPDLHGEPFNFGPPGDQSFSVANLIDEMSNYWEKVNWEDTSSDYDGPNEAGLLKLNCDKALHMLGWKAAWDFRQTVKETVEWYRTFYKDRPGSMADSSKRQIMSYEQSARERGIRWAL
jgi:CDP-glucose 4,6-dehydratase